MSQMLSTMRKPSRMDVGPFHVSDITDYVRGDLVAKQKVPITLEQKGRFAILAPPGKDLRIVCVGCFEPGMSLNDDRKCKKISSYCQHWEGVNKGKFTCNATDEDTLEADTKRLHSVEAVNTLEEPVLNVDVKGLKEFSTEDLVLELKRRNEDFEFILPLMNIDTVVQFTKERGVKPLYDSRFNDLEAEMRRVTDPTRPEIGSFYAATQVDNKPHYLQEPMVTIDDMLEWHKNRVRDVAEGTALISNKRLKGKSVATVKKVTRTSNRKRKAKVSYDM
jgi:hypothetical protein